MSERVPAIKVLLLPKDTNAFGTIFGGVILSHVDLASAVEARKSGAHRFVTKAMREVEFLAPVFVGDIVNFFTETRRVGRTSVTVGVTVEAERWGAGAGERVKVTEAEVVLVAIGADGQPVAGRVECGGTRMIAAFAPGHRRRTSPPDSTCWASRSTSPATSWPQRLRDEPGVAIVDIVGDGGRLTRDTAKNTAGSAVEALLAHAGHVARHRAHDSQGPAARERHGQQRRQRGGGRGGGERAARPAGVDRPRVPRRDGRASAPGAAPPIPTTWRRRSSAASCWRAAPIRPTSCASRCPRGCRAPVLHPHLEVQTGAARALLGDTLPLQTAVRQWANLGALVSALHTGDLALLSRSLVDHVAEPKRASLVPGFAQVKAAAAEAGALGCSLSGSGPSIFALARSLDEARAPSARPWRRPFATAAPTSSRPLGVGRRHDGRARASPAGERR